ncbi:HesA/MoeB/ThiF family protein [Lutimonas sp.]|uniref:HesA/MoeB/ThiF family protein n=1 Tax=Lutimonas sp. TaxID=1872403 RepID=UPI003D9B6B58
MSKAKEKMFIRQTTLPELGARGQEKLLASKVAIVGCGGLGSTAAVYLAASGVGHIHLIDYDTIDTSNLHRQVFYTLDEVGTPKVTSLARHIENISPFVTVSYSDQPIAKNSIDEELQDYPVILDCTDSLPTKYLLNDYCVLKNKVLVYGSLYKHDGYAAVFNLPTKKGRSANLRDAFPEMPQQHVPNCSEIGTLNPIVGIIALMQSNETIKLISGIGKGLADQILIYNAMDNSQYKMKLNPKFPVERIAKIYNKENYFDPGCEVQDPLLLIDASEFKKRLDKGSMNILSVIGDSSYSYPFDIDLRMTNSKFDAAKVAPLLQHELGVVCQKGISSYAAVKKIKKAYPSATVYSLKHGLENY